MVPGSPFIQMSPTARVGIIGGYAALFLIAAVGALMNPLPASRWVLLSLAAHLAVTLYPVLAYRPEYGWLHPLMFMVIRGLLGTLNRLPLYMRGMQYHIGLPGWTANELTQLVAYGLALHTVALASMYAGYLSRIRLPLPRVSFPKMQRPGVVAMTFLGISVFSFLLILYLKGGLFAHLTSWRSIGRVAGNHAYGPLIKIASLAPSACLIWFTADRKAVYKPWFWGSAAIALTMTFLLTGSRSWTLVPLLLAVVVWMLRERQLATGRVLALILVVIVGVGALGRFRNSIQEQIVPWDSLVSVGMGETLAEGREEIYNRTGPKNSFYPLLARVPREIPLNFGRQYLQATYSVIPRVLWPDRPSAAGLEAGQVFLNRDAGYSPTAIGESYWAFHIPGVVVLYFCFGIALRWVVDVYRVHAGKAGALVLFTTILMNVKGPSLKVIVTMPAILGGIVLMLYIAGGIRFGRASKTPARAVQPVPAGRRM